MLYKVSAWQLLYFVFQVCKKWLGDIDARGHAMDPADPGMTIHKFLVFFVIGSLIVKGFLRGWTLLYCTSQIIRLQEAMESFAFPDKINSIITEIPQKCSKLLFFSLESFKDSLYFGTFTQRGNEKNGKNVILLQFS